jgi:hypothetical protein
MTGFPKMMDYLTVTVNDKAGIKACCGGGDRQKVEPNNEII